MSAFDGASGVRNSGGEVRRAVSLLLLAGGVFILCAAPVTLIIFTGPKMAAEPGGLSMEAVSASQALYWVGWSASSVIIMPRIDRYGRCVPAYTLLALGAVAAYASTCITSARSYSLCIFFMGMCLPTSSMIIYLLITESVPGWFKPAVSSSLNAGFSLLEVLIAAFCAGDAAMDWRTESRLWYSPYVFFLLLGVAFVRDPPTRKAAADDATAAVGFACLRRPSMRLRAAATCLCWCACSVSYYGLSYSAGSLSPNTYVNVGLLGVIDAVGYSAAMALIAPLGAHTAQVVSFVVAAAALFACGLAPSGSWAVISLALVGRFFINVAFSTCYLLLVTCFPAECRGAASGLANSFARLSSLAAPFCSLLPVGLCCSVLGLLVLAAAGATTALPASDAGGAEEEEEETVDELRQAWLSADPWVAGYEDQKRGGGDAASLLLRL